MLRARIEAVDALSQGERLPIELLDRIASRATAITRRAEKEGPV